MARFFLYLIEIINNKAWLNLIDAKFRWRSYWLDGTGSFWEPLGQMQVMQIRQGETLNHQGAITHEVCCLAAQIYETKTYEFIKMWFYIEQLSLILEESVSQNLWGSQGKLCKENLGYCPEVFFYPPLLKRSIFSSHILPVIQKRHEYCTTFNVHKVINQSLCIFKVNLFEEDHNKSSTFGTG